MSGFTKNIEGNNEVIKYEFTINDINYEFRFKKWELDKYFTTVFRVKGIKIPKYSVGKDLSHLNKVYNVLYEIIEDVRINNSEYMIKFHGTNPNSKEQTIRTKSYVRFLKRKYDEKIISVNGNKIFINKEI